MANDALASGQVVITANADRMVQGLKKADQDVKHWSKGLAGGIGSEIATELGKRGFAGGVLGGIIGGGAGGAISELVANTLGELGVTDLLNEAVKGVFDWVKGTNELQAAMSRVTDEIAKANTEQDKMLAKSAEQRKSMIHWGDEVLSINDDLKKLSDRWNELDNRTRRLQEYMSKNSLFQNEIDANNAMITSWTNAQNKITDDMNKLIEKKDALLDPAKNEALKQSIAGATRELQKQAATWGLTEEAAKRAALVFDGAQEGMLRDFDIAAAEMQRLRASGPAAAPLGLIMNAALNAAGAAAQIPKPGQSGPTALSAAVEAGTAQGYSLIVGNRFGGIEGGSMNVHKQNGAKLDAIRSAIDGGLKRIEDAFRGVGIV